MSHEAARTSETSVDNYFTRQYIPEDKSELHTHRRENLKSHTVTLDFVFMGSVLFSVWTVIISLNSVNKFMFVMVKYSVLFEIRTEFLNIIQTRFGCRIFKGDKVRNTLSFGRK
jgi:hypothetical protein